MENACEWVIFQELQVIDIELPRDHFISFSENQSFFGLKKEINIEFLLHNKIRKQKFNISMLSIKTI